MKLTELAAKLKLDKGRVVKVLCDSGMPVTEDSDLDSAAVERLLQDVGKLTEGLGPLPANPPAPAAPADAVSAGAKKKINPSLSELSENLGIDLAALAEQAAKLGVKTVDVSAELSEEEGNLILDNLQVIISSISKKSQAVESRPSPSREQGSPENKDAGVAQPLAAPIVTLPRPSVFSMRMPPLAYVTGAAVFFIAFLSTALIATRQRPAPAVRQEQAIPVAGLGQDKLQAKMVWKTAEEGYYSTAYELCQDFIRDFPGSKLLEDVYFKRGEIVFAWEKKLPAAQYGSAIAAFDEAVAKFPESSRVARALHLTATAYIKLNVRDKAADTFASLFSRYPSYAQREEALFQYAGCLAELNRYQDAISSCSDYLRSFPRSPNCADALYLTAQCWAKMKKNAKAVTAYTTFLARYPKDKRRDEALFSLAGVYYESGKYDQAFSLYRKTLGRYPWDTYNDRAYLMLAECRARKASFTDAGQYLDELIYTYPDSPYVAQAQYRRADFLLAQAKPAEACAQYEKALAKYPKHERAYAACVTLAKLYFAAAKYSHCVRVCGVLLTEFRNSAGNDSIRMMMGQAYKGKKDYIRALDSFGRLIEDYPASDLVEQAYFQKADCQFSLELYAPAVSTYVHIFSLFPQTVRRDVLLFRLGECSYKLGRYEEAKNYFSDCVSREPLSEYSRRALVARGRCLAKLGQAQQAHEDLRAVLNDPSSRNKDFYAAACLEEARLLKAEGKAIPAAEAALKGLIDPLSNPAYLDCLRLAAESYRAAGMPWQAMDLWMKSVSAAVEAKDAVSPDIRPQFVAECRLGLADAQFLAGQRKAALANYLFAARTLGTKTGKSWALFQSAEILLRDGKEKYAAILYAKLRRSFPESYWRKQAQWRLSTLTRKVK